MIELRVPSHAPARGVVNGVQEVAGAHPGDHELRLLVESRASMNGRQAPSYVTLTLGPEWRYDGSPGCLEALSAWGEASIAGGR